MAHQLTIWVTNPENIEADEFVWLHTLGGEIAVKYPNLNIAFLVEEVAPEETDEDEDGDLGIIVSGGYDADEDEPSYDGPYSEGEYLAEKINNGEVRP